MTLKQFMDKHRFTANERFALKVIEQLSDKVKMLESTVSSLRLQLDIKDEQIQRDQKMIDLYLDTIKDLATKQR